MKHISLCQHCATKAAEISRLRQRVAELELALARKPHIATGDHEPTLFIPSPKPTTVEAGLAPTVRDVEYPWPCFACRGEPKRYKDTYGRTCHECGGTGKSKRVRKARRPQAQAEVLTEADLDNLDMSF